MSASPAASGTPGATPNGTPRPPMPRKKPPADPLIRRKPLGRPTRAPAFAHDPNAKDPSKPANNPKPANQLQAAGNQKPLRDAKPSNDVKALSRPQASRPRDRARFEGATELEKPEAQMQSASVSLVDADTGLRTSGFTTAKPGTYTDYPVFISRGELTAGLRAHVARFSSRQDIDPSSQQEWTRPVRLHRRDTRAVPTSGKPEALDRKDAEIEEDRQKQELLRAQREAERAAALAEIAPSMSNPNAKRGGAGQRKTTQFFGKEATAEQRERNKIRYEEAMPWHLEDFDNRQTWVGTYEAALSNTWAQLVFKDNKFHIAPLEKWYKFTQNRVFKTQEELEASEAKRGTKNQKWLQNYEQDQEAKKIEQQNRMAYSTLWDHTKGGASKVSLGSSAIKDKEDFDELDFEDDMADDEEDPVYEGEGDETKETQKRIKKDQLQANIFDMKDEKSYDRAERLEKIEQRARKDHGKKARKLLMKRERNYIYDSDSDHAYSEQSESEDSDEERRKEEENQKEAEEKKKGTLPGSGASTKGTNTPSGRKKQDPQRSATSNTLKRSGSHDLSEASGNESAQKRQKKKHGTSSGLASGVNTPNGPSRSRSPAINSDTNAGRSNGTANLKKKTTATRGNELKRPRGAGSGSEGEGAGSGGDMSDGSRKKIKLKTGAPGSKNVSPGGSRATSPNRDAAVTGGQPVAKTGKNPGPPPTIPTPEEVKKNLPVEGLAMNSFTKLYRPIVNHPETRSAFMELVKAHFRLVTIEGVKMIQSK